MAKPPEKPKSPVTRAARVRPGTKVVPTWYVRAMREWAKVAKKHPDGVIIVTILVIVGAFAKIAGPTLEGHATAADLGCIAILSYVLLKLVSVFKALVLNVRSVDAAYEEGATELKKIMVHRKKTGQNSTKK